MTIYSMTGSASRGQTLPDTPGAHRTRLTADIRSVNNRFLDLSLRIPDALRAAEPALRRLVAHKLQRGKVELRITLVQDDASAQAAPDLARLQALRDLQNHVLRILPSAPPLSVAEVLGLCSGATAPQTGTAWTDAAVALCDALVDDLLHARAAEGERLVAAIRTRTGALRELVHKARPLVPAAIAAQREHFLARWNEAVAALGAQAPNAAPLQERALAEVTSFALRIDVAEELDRTDAHLDAVESVLQQGGGAGKRLDFLAQELHREANTLGSKAASLELTRIALDAKVLIEQIREQVQNIE